MIALGRGHLRSRERAEKSSRGATGGVYSPPILDGTMGSMGSEILDEIVPVRPLG